MDMYVRYLPRLEKAVNCGQLFYVPRANKQLLLVLSVSELIGNCS